MANQHETTLQAAPKPVCPACAAGYHDEVLVTHQDCACPCHGTLNGQTEVTA